MESCLVAMQLFNNRSNITSNVGRNKNVAHKLQVQVTLRCITVGFTLGWAYQMEDFLLSVFANV